jgi:hypothetical protein
MDLKHLSDNELIDHIIKYDSDPIRVRLATHMQRVAGAIIDDLIDAGMDNTWCTFENTYHPGQYIRHLENEVQYLNHKLSDANKEIKNLQARTIMEVFAELKQEIKTAEFAKEMAIKDRQAAERKEEEMKHKLDMWAILNR